MGSGLFPNKDPNYKPHLSQSDNPITEFKVFEQALQELKFCKNKLKALKDKKQRAAEIAAEPFLEEEELLDRQVQYIQNKVEDYLDQNMEEQAELINSLPDVKFEEIHKFKIKFTKEKKNNEN